MTGDIPAQPTTRSAVAIVRRSPALRRFFLAATAFAVANAVLFPVLVPFLRGTLQASAAEVGLLFAVLSAAGLLTAPVSGPLMQRFGPRVVYRAGAAGTTVGLLLLGLSPDIDTATIAVVFIGVCFGVAQVTLLQQAVPDSQLGRIFGVLATLMALVKLVAAVLPLALLSLLGTRGTLLSAVVACALGTVVAVRERPVSVRFPLAPRGLPRDRRGVRRETALPPPCTGPSSPGG
jgi:MFS family permease